MHIMPLRVSFRPQLLRKTYVPSENPTYIQSKNRDDEMFKQIPIFEIILKVPTQNE